MGINIPMAPDVYQHFMVKFIQDMEYAKNYLDDLLIISNL
jgi:hypothetical protein